jgi:X-X-X-Leu-X-X-Gly heptad repeat protein
VPGTCQAVSTAHDEDSPAPSLKLPTPDAVKFTTDAEACPKELESPAKQREGRPKELVSCPNELVLHATELLSDPKQSVSRATELDSGTKQVVSGVTELDSGTTESGVAHPSDSFARD